MSEDSRRSTVQEPRDQQTGHSSREPKQQGARKFSVQESRRLTPSEGSNEQGPSKKVLSQETVVMRSGSQNRSRQVRPSVICSAQLVAKSSASARSACPGVYL